MGIKNLNKFLKNNCIEAFSEISLNDFSYKKVAIDVTLFLFKYKAIFKELWLDGFINLICSLRKHNIHCIFIFDNVSPKEKETEKKRRQEHKEKLQQKIDTISESINKFHNDNILDPLLQNIFDKFNTKPKRLLISKNIFDISVIETYLQKIKNQVIKTDKNDFDLIKKLFEIFNIPYLLAKTEAEKTCSFLSVSGLVDAVLSDDTDVIAYGTPITLSKINTSKGTCIKIEYDIILEKLGLTKKQFLDLCIMCGTDYNDNIPKVGPETSYKLIKEHQSLEMIEENTKLLTDILNYKMSRKLFSLEDEDINLKVPFCGIPDFIKLDNFIFENNCRNDKLVIQKSFKNNFSFDN